MLNDVTNIISKNLITKYNIKNLKDVFNLYHEKEMQADKLAGNYILYQLEK